MKKLPTVAGATTPPWLLSRTRLDIPARIAGIIAAVAQEYGLTPTSLTAVGRGKVVVSWPRQVAMYLASTLTGATPDEIGLAFGRDGTTVGYACRVVRDTMETHPAVASDIARIQRKLEGGGK